jgi:hypothetical protein
MSEAEILKVLQTMKDKQLADLIRSYMNEPTTLRFLLITTKLGITMESGKVNAIINNVTFWYETDEYEEPEIYLQLGGVVYDGLLYVLELVYNHHEKSAKIQLKQKTSMILQFIEIGEQNEKE